MGKRKKSSRKPQGPKKVDPLPTVFTCLFCNHEKSVTVKLDKKAGVGQLDCRVCGQKFQCGINYLSAAVDVYGEWVDAAGTYGNMHVFCRALFNSRLTVWPDAVSKEKGPSRVAEHSASHASKSARHDSEPDEDEDAGYTGEGIVDDDDEVY